MRAGITFRRERKVERYEAALRRAGIEPVRITPGRETSLDAIDGLVLTGGTDINPARYRQARAPECEDPDDERDELELRVLAEALRRDVPVLGICRGLQLFNVAHGGTLIQHLSGTAIHNSDLPFDEAAHPVRIAAGTRLAAIAGAGEHSVNSRHHQAVDRLGEGLVISAVAPDGVVEAIELPDKPFAIAVQWHPEDRAHIDGCDRALMESFAAALSARRPAEIPR